MSTGGSGVVAVAARRRRGMVSGARSISIVSLFALALFAISVSSASAAKIRPSKGTFGSAAQPSFTHAGGLAVDQSNGDLLVIEYVESYGASGTLERFKENGEPDPFSALGTNVIDGKKGPRGEPCADEPASCDETPGNAGVLTTEGVGPSEVEVAVAPPGAAAGTEGDIYVTDALGEVVDIFAPSGEYIGQDSFGFPCGVAVDPAGEVFVGSYEREEAVYKLEPTAPGELSEVAQFPTTNPCQLAAGAGPSAGYIFAAQFLHSPVKIASEGAEEGNPQYTVPSGEDTTSFSVDPATGDLFTASQTAVRDYDVSGSTEATEVTPPIPLASAALGVAVDENSGNTYIARAGDSQIEVFGQPFSPPTVLTESASAPQKTTSILHGRVGPEGQAVEQCAFEYGPISAAGFPSQVACAPDAAEIPADTALHSVTGTLAGLQSGTTYRFRLTVRTEGNETSGEELEFTTKGGPQISGLRAFGAGQTSASVEAQVNPRGFPTRYRIEWGPTTTYGHVIPANGTEPFLGSGEQAVPVTGELTGLTAATTYHYRVVATSAEGGVTIGPDQTVETVDACGLPEQRCFELVSPRDVGPVASPGRTPGGSELHFQAALAPGSLAYSAESGFPDASKGAEVLYLGDRAENGAWTSSQLSAPILANNETPGGESTSAKTLALSENLSCGFLESNQPLTSDPGARLVREAGGGNLYRRNADGSFTAVTALPPENPEVNGVNGGSLEYHVDGLSRDCAKVVFTTLYRYPGIEGVGETRLYEWDGGTLRNVGIVPGSTGEVPVLAVPGGKGTSRGNHSNVVSSDGSRVFFTATSQAGNDEDNQAVFVRIDGEETLDVSQSPLAVDTGASFQFATKDGSRVYFTANAGLTAESSPGGQDLYEYDFGLPEGERLVDLSVGHATGGAQVEGFVGASEDGSVVYFVARGQLVANKGKTFAENMSGGTYSLYEERGGVASLIATVGSQLAEVRAAELGRLTLNSQAEGSWTSRVSPDGQDLLFETTADVTGYEAGNYAPEAYLYDDMSEETVCISCRRDGEPSVSPNLVAPLQYEGATNPLYAIPSLIERDGQPQVYFASFDRLAPGAVEGVSNLYEWSHGQVFAIAAEPAGLGEVFEETHEGQIFSDIKTTARFAGASADGTDLYFVTPQSLNWEDGDGRSSVYDARVGGGFPEPPGNPAPCDATSEGSCQGAASAGQSSTPAPASSTFNGPGNIKHKKKHKKTQSKKKHKKTQSKKKHKKTQSKNAQGNRRAGK
jgi:hypothetical protein